MYHYDLYGVSLRSAWPLACESGVDPQAPDVELFEAPAGVFRAASREANRRLNASRWAQYLSLPDGSEYLRWRELFEFLVLPDGRQIAGRRLKRATMSAFGTYLLGQVLSHALIKLGFEPLHATVVEVDGTAVAFLGSSGRGKSTLAATFIQAGHRLLTDDLLIVAPDGPELTAYPGVPRIKLFPEVAAAVLRGHSAGSPMNAATLKLVIPLADAACPRTPLPLSMVYVLGPVRARPGSPRVATRRVSPRRAFLELVKNTYNRDVVSAHRLHRQMLLNSRIVRAVPVRTLEFPRQLSWLPSVRAAILGDLRDMRRTRAQGAVGRLVPPATDGLDASAATLG